jgi:hypothetical protein
MDQAAAGGSGRVRAIISDGSTRQGSFNLLQIVARHGLAVERGSPQDRPSFEGPMVGGSARLAENMDSGSGQHELPAWNAAGIDAWSR